jgi:hypothetical protein
MAGDKGKDAYGFGPCMRFEFGSEFNPSSLERILRMLGLTVLIEVGFMGSGTVRKRSFKSTNR